MEQNARAHLIITGRVQGVFFRVETQRAARQFGVTGWVRNKRDGSVEAAAEGTKTDVQSLIQWCHTGPPNARVDDVKISWQEHSGEFERFEVRY